MFLTGQWEENNVLHFLFYIPEVIIRERSQSFRNHVCSQLFQTAPFTHMYLWWQLASHEISHERKTSGVSRDSPRFLG